MKLTRTWNCEKKFYPRVKVARIRYWIYLRTLCFLLHMCVHPTVLFSLISHVSSCVLEFVYSKFVLVFLQESLKPDLLISNLNRTNSSSGDLNRVSYNDLCFPKISNYGSMKKKKHCHVGVECKLSPPNNSVGHQQQHHHQRYT